MCYLNTAMLIFVRIACGCLYIKMAELSSYDKDHMASKAENICNLALYRKSWQTSDLVHL